MKVIIPVAGFGKRLRPHTLTTPKVLLNVAGHPMIFYIVGQLIKDKIIRENDLKVDEKEILEHAKKFTAMQFQQYGLTNIEDAHIENYAKEMLNKAEEKRKISDRLYEDKIIDYIKETLKIDKKEISVDDFNKLFEEKKKKNQA